MRILFTYNVPTYITKYFYFQVEFYRLLSFIYDDFPDIMWGMGRTVMGLHESRIESGKLIFQY